MDDETRIDEVDHVMVDVRRRFAQEDVVVEGADAAVAGAERVEDDLVLGLLARVFRCRP
jgi:hypothetical protein